MTCLAEDPTLIAASPAWTSQLPAVDFAASDARKAATYFVNLLGVPDGQVVLMENEKATRSAVTSRLKDYFPGNLGKDSVLYVYFAGHGMPDVVTGEPYLMFFDSESTHVSRTGYAMKELLSDLGAMDIAQTFLFTDACFSGMAARGEEMLVKGARPAVLRVEDVKLATGKVVAVGASTGSQLSHAYKEKRQGRAWLALVLFILGIGLMEAVKHLEHAH